MSALMRRMSRWGYFILVHFWWFLWDCVYDDWKGSYRKTKNFRKWRWCMLLLDMEGLGVPKLSILSNDGMLSCISYRSVRSGISGDFAWFWKARMIGCNILGMSIWIPFGVLNLDIDSIDTRGELDACWKKLSCEWMDVARGFLVFGWRFGWFGIEKDEWCFLRYFSIVCYWRSGWEEASGQLMRNAQITFQTNVFQQKSAESFHSRRWDSHYKALSTIIVSFLEEQVT